MLHFQQLTVCAQSAHIPTKRDKQNTLANLNTTTRSHIQKKTEYSYKCKSEQYTSSESYDVRATETNIEAAQAKGYKLNRDQ